MRKFEIKTEFKKAPTEKPTNAEYSVKGTLTRTPRRSSGGTHNVIGGITKDHSTLDFKKRRFYAICSIEIEQEDGSLFQGNFYVRRNVAKFLRGGLKCEVFIYDDVFIELVVLSDGLGSVSNFMLRQGSENYRAVAHTILAVSFIFCVMLWLPYEPFVEFLSKALEQPIHIFHKVLFTAVSIVPALKFVFWSSGILKYKERLRKRRVVVKGDKPSLKRVKAMLNGE